MRGPGAGPAASTSLHRALGACVLGACVLALAGCGRRSAPGDASPPRHPILLAAVDGLEWDLVLPLVRQGKLPVLASLLDRGVFGNLRTLVPANSPVIWTTVATGKMPPKHGILDFYRMRGTEPELYTSADRTTKAFWNIYSDQGLRVHVIGWWMTWPVEPVNGTMVAQTNTLSQVDVRHGRAVWKGTLVPGAQGQVHPPEMEDTILGHAKAVSQELPRLLSATFGERDRSGSELARRLWDNTRWAFRADRIYQRVAEATLSSREPHDLLAVYFGGTDVVGHRFWRYMQPEAFAEPPPAADIAAFGDVIERYYGWVDQALGRLLALGPGDVTVLVVSDHGMHAVNQGARFAPDDPPEDVNSGNHQDGPPGLFAAAGRGILAARAVDPRAPGLTGASLPLVGSVLDITPTLLVLKGIAVGADMDGRPLLGILDPQARARVPATAVATHDTAQWLASRPGGRPLSPDHEERLDQLRALGYIE